MRIAVAGGTGCAGRLIVDAVGAAGHEATVISRSAGVDLTTGQGLDQALVGVSRVIDASNVTTTGRAKSVAFFEAATGQLLRAEEKAGVAHHVVLSIVNCDRVDFGYYHGKRRQEALVQQGSVPYSILRATQFHEFAAQMLARRGPLALVPRMRCRPVAAREVAQALAALALAEPAGTVTELSGPEERDMVQMARQLQQARGGRRLVLPVRLPGRAGKAMVDGGLLPEHPGPQGELTFDDWVAG